MNTTELKARTAEEHDAIEAAMNAPAIFEGTYPRSAYHKLLRASYHYLQSIHQDIQANWPTWLPFIDRKMEAIEADLPSIKTAEPAQAKEVGSQSNSLGKLYVIMGAMLGNNVMFKKLKDQAEFSGEPFHYLTLHQEEASTLWKQFLETIDNWDPAELEDIIQGAKDGYAALMLRSQEI